MAIFMNLGGMKLARAFPLSHEWMELLTFKLGRVGKQHPMMSSLSGNSQFGATATKVADRATAGVAQLHTAGVLLPLCTVRFTKGDAPNTVAALKFSLHDVLVVGFRTTSYSPMPKPVDEFEFAFKRITLEHHSARSLSPMEADALSNMWKASARN